MEIGNLQAEKSQLAVFTVGRLLRKKVRGSRSQAITYAKKGDYALRDILLIMQQ